MSDPLALPAGRYKRAIYGDAATGYITSIDYADFEHAFPDQPLLVDYVDEIVPFLAGRMRLVETPEGPTLVERELLTPVVDKHQAAVGAAFKLSFPELPLDRALILVINRALQATTAAGELQVSFDTPGTYAIRLLEGPASLPYRMDPVILEVTP